MHAVIRRLNYFRLSLLKHTISAYAAQTAFFILLAFFPFTMLVLETLRYLPFTEEEFLALILSVTPDTLGTAIEGLVAELYTTQSNIIPLTVITALWSSSKGVYALMRGINTVFECRETRSYIKRRGYAILYTLIFLTALIFSIGIMVFGEWVLDKVIYRFGSQALFTAARMITQIVFLSLLFAVIYRFFPSDSFKFSNLLPGAVISACGWIVFTELYSVYVTVKNTDIYGSLATVILTMLWLYICIYILLIGAEINIFLIKIEKREIK